MGVQNSDPRATLPLPDPQDRNAPAHERLLHAVICLLMEQGVTLVGQALTPDDVTKRAGKSRASYYRTEGFPASDVLNSDGRRAVLEEAVASALRSSSGELSQLLGSIKHFIEEGWISDSPREFIRQTALGNFESMIGHESRMQLLAGALSTSSPALATALHEYYSTVVGAYSVGYTEVLSFAKFHVRAPFDVEYFTTVMMAVAEGLMLRATGDERITAELFASAIETVAMAMLVADGDFTESSQPSHFYLPGSSPLPSRSSIVAAFVQLMEEERITLPTVAELAARAGCSETTIREHFGGVIGVVRAAWDEWATEFEETAERNRRQLQSADPMTVLYRVAAQVAVRAAQQRSLTRARLMSELSSGSAPGVQDDAVVRIFARLLDEAEEARLWGVPAIHNDRVVTDRNHLFARMLSASLLNVVVGHPVPTGMTLEDHAHWCVDYVWAILMPPVRGQ